MLADGFSVAEAGVEHIRHGDHSTWPGHIVGVAAPIGWDDVGQRTVVPLTVVAIAEPLGVELVVVEDIRFAEVARGAVASPAHAFVALRAVGGHRAVVASDAPIGVFIHRVDDFVGGLKRAGYGHLVIDDPALEVVQIGRLAQAGDFNVAEAVVDEHRMPVYC